nr:MAG TPA: hypothetical protein [Caudoviricetes sp.]
MTVYIYIVCIFVYISIYRKNYTSFFPPYASKSLALPRGSVCRYPS